MFNRFRYIKLTPDEVTLISDYRADKKVADCNVKHLETLIENSGRKPNNFLFSSTNLYDFFNKIFLTYYQWCSKNGVCFTCSLNQMIDLVIERKSSTKYTNQLDGSGQTHQSSSSLH